MTKTIENLLAFYVAAGVDLLIVLLFISFFKKAKTEKNLWIISLYCLFSLLINYSIEIFFPEQINEFYTFFTLLEYLFFAYFFWTNIEKDKFKKLILILSPIFIVFVAVYSIITDFKSLDSVPIGIETILILVYSFYYLYEQMNTTNLFIYSRPPFWIVIGIMIYLAGSFFIYIFANQVDYNTLAKYWFLTNVFYIVKNILFIIAFFNYLKEKKSPRPKNLYPYLN